MYVAGHNVRLIQLSSSRTTRVAFGAQSTLPISLVALCCTVEIHIVASRPTPRIHRTKHKAFYQIILQSQGILLARTGQDESPLWRKEYRAQTHPQQRNIKCKISILQNRLASLPRLYPLLLTSPLLFSLQSFLLPTHNSHSAHSNPESRSTHASPPSTSNSPPSTPNSPPCNHG